MTKTQTRIAMEKQPHERWRVEWCSEMPVTEFGDADIDRAVYSHRSFAFPALAIAFARNLLRGLIKGTTAEYGVCRIDRQEMRVDAGILASENWRTLAWEDVETTGEISSPDDEIKFEPSRNW
jgi:hypothetical protein